MAEERSQTGEPEGDAPSEAPPVTDASRAAEESASDDADEALAWSSMDLPGMDPADGDE